MTKNKRRLTDTLVIIASLTIGFFIRLWYVQISSYSIDSDNGIIGLMGKHILEGEFPVFFYGQVYMGSIEAFAAAFFFAWLGFSKFTLALAPLFFSLLFILSTYFLGREFSGRKAGLMAMLLVTFPAFHLIAYSGAARGGYIETLFFGNLLLIFTHKICYGRNSAKKEYLLFFFLGLMAGLGLWTHLLIMYYLPVTAFFLFVYNKKIFFSSKSLVAGFSFFVGSMPFWIYNFQNGFISFCAIRTFQRAKVLEALHKLYFQDIPLLLNLQSRNYQMGSAHKFLAVIMAIIYLAAFLYLVVCSGKGLIGLSKLSLRRTNGREMLLIFLLSLSIIFSLSHFGLFRTQRYILPLFSLIPLALAYLFIKIKEHSKLVFFLLFAFMISFNLFGLTKAYSMDKDWLREEDREFVELLKFLDENNINRVIIKYWISAKITFLSKEKIICSTPEDERYPVYEFLVDASRNPAIITRPNKHFARVLESLGGEFKFKRIGSYYIYYAFRPPLGLSRGLSSKGWSAKSNFRPDLTQFAFDRNADTRWSSGWPKKDGMYYQLDLSRAYTVNKLGFLNISHKHNYPTGYLLEGSLDEKNWFNIVDLSLCEFIYWSGPRLFWGGNDSKIEVCFSPVKVRFIKITQRGEHSLHPWEINELYVGEYSGKKRPPADDLDENLGALMNFIKEKDFELVYAGRWLSAKIMEATETQCLRPHNNRYPKMALTSRLVDFFKDIAFVVEKEDWQLEQMLRRFNIETEKKQIGSYLIYYSPQTENKLIRTGLYWTGKGLLKTDFKREKEKAGLCFQAGLKYRQRKLWAEAIEKFEEAVNFCPNHLEALYYLSECYRHKGCFKDAEGIEKIIKTEFQPEYKREANIANRIKFLGYSLDTKDISAGDSFKITYFWKCLKKMKKNYVVFVHFISGKGKIFQDDHLPLSGENPTNKWVKGEVIIDSSRVRVPEDITPGTFDICIGFWNPYGDKKRLKVGETNLPLPDGKIMIGKINVVRG